MTYIERIKKWLSEGVGISVNDVQTLLYRFWDSTVYPFIAIFMGIGIEKFIELRNISFVNDGGFWADVVIAFLSAVAGGVILTYRKYKRL